MRRRRTTLLKFLEEVAGLWRLKMALIIELVQVRVKLAARITVFRERVRIIFRVDAGPGKLLCHDDHLAFTIVLPLIAEAIGIRG